MVAWYFEQQDYAQLNSDQESKGNGSTEYIEASTSLDSSFYLRQKVKGQTQNCKKLRELKEIYGAR